jgi:hypothetical protein
LDNQHMVIPIVLYYSHYFKILLQVYFCCWYYTFSKLNNPTNVLLLMFELSCILIHIFWNLNIWIIKIWISLKIRFRLFSMDVAFQTSFSICMQNVFGVCGLIKHALKVLQGYKEMSTHFEFKKKNLNMRI